VGAPHPVFVAEEVEYPGYARRDGLQRGVSIAISDPSVDDTPTLIALGVLAFTCADMVHEGLGHGLATLALGGRPVILTTAWFGSSGSSSRWIPAAGGIANVIVGFLSILASHLLPAPGSRLRYLLILSLAFNLLFATGYPAYSGIALFGDWATVISGRSPAWLWRTLLVVFSVISYYLSLRLIAVEIRPFGGSDARLRRITLIPYLAAVVVAGLAGAFNPQGWTTIFTAALPSAGAAAGFTQMDHFRAAHSSEPSLQAKIITRSAGWIVTSVIVGTFFVLVLGPGIRFAATTQ
jgi:hypothetical protein